MGNQPDECELGDYPPLLLLPCEMVRQALSKGQRSTLSRLVMTYSQSCDWVEYRIVVVTRTLILIVHLKSTSTAASAR